MGDASTSHFGVCIEGSGKSSRSFCLVCVHQRAWPHACDGPMAGAAAKCAQAKPAGLRRLDRCGPIGWSTQPVFTTPATQGRDGETVIRRARRRGGPSVPLACSRAGSAYAGTPSVGPPLTTDYLLLPYSFAYGYPTLHRVRPGTVGDAGQRHPAGRGAPIRCFE